MSKLYKYVVALVVAITFGATTSSIAFEGFSFGVIGNSATFDTSGSETEGSTETGSDKEENSGSHSHDVEYPALFLEATTGTAGGFGMTVGIEYIPGSTSIGAKSRTDATSDAKEASQDDGTYTAKAEVDNHVTFYLEPTYMMNETFGLYGKLGATHVNIKSLESIDVGADSSAYGDKGAWGGMYGIGIKAVHSSGLFFKLEGMKTEYSEIKLKSTSGSKAKNIKATPEQTAARIAIGYNF